MTGFADFSTRARRVSTRVAVRGAILASVLGVAACTPGGSRRSVDASVPSLQGAPTTPVQSEPLSGPQEQIGSGAVKVGLVLPLTQNGAPNAAGVALKNAATLALDESKDKTISLIVEDDQSTTAGAAAAVRAALDQNAALIIGPLFSPSVAQAAQQTRAANVPMIAFSTDAGVASRGVYLLSFLIETYVDRVVDYAVGQGKRSFGAMIPDNDYGRVAEAEFLQETARLGAVVRQNEHYGAGKAADAAKRLAPGSRTIDALFIPDQAAAMPDVAAALTAAGIDSKRILLMGTGLWNDPKALALPALQGAVFAAPDAAGFSAFANNYRARFGAEPLRIATLAHDAVSLASALARGDGAQPFTAAALTNPSGFRGVDGVFRFRSDGLNDRGLAVDAIRDKSAVVVSPAPQTFQ